MKILFICPYVPSLIRVRPYNFVRELSRRHEVTVLAVGSGREINEVDKLRAVCHRVDGVPLRLASISRSLAMAGVQGEPLQAAFCRSREMERQVSSRIAEEAFDVVHIEHLRAAHVRAFVPQAMPTVFDSVDCISLLLERTLRFSHSLRQRIIAALELRRTRAYEARLLQLFDGVAVTSPDDGKALARLAPGVEPTVVHNGVDLDYFQPVQGPREPATIVLSGKMSYHANVTAALHFVRDILPLVKTYHPQVRLRIVGSSPPAAVRALASDPSIDVTGSLPDIRPALGSATLAVCPVTVKVGMQNKVLEAMAMGLPVVSTKDGVEGLGVKAGRDLLVGDDPTEFAAHIGRLLEQSDLSAQLGRMGRRYVETYHRWDDSARLLETLYQEAIERRTHRMSRNVLAKPLVSPTS